MKNALRASGAAGLATTTVLTALAFGPPAGALPSSEPGPTAVTTHPAGTERASVAVTASATFADDVRTVVQVAGTARAGATITVRRGDDVLATTTADASGAWTAPVNAPNTPGVQALTVVQSVDGTETRIPLDVDYGPGVVVTSPPDGSQLTPGEALQVAGTAPSGTEVVVHEQGRREVLGTARADAGGGWRVAVDGLENRATTLVAEGITKGYNRTAAELRVAPAPVQPAAPTKVSGYFPPDNSAWAHITGEGITPGALVQIRQGTTLIASGTATGTTFDLPIDPSRTGYGTQDFTVTQTVDGIESDSTPVTLDYGQNAATFTSPTEGAQVPGTPLQFTGTGTPGADIEIHGTDFTQDTAIATATVKPDGTWTATNTTITLPQGPYQFWTHQHTKGGKVGYSHIGVIVVAPAPVQPAAPTEVSGYFPADNSAWAHITGEGITPGALVQIRQGTTLIASGTATGTTFDLPIDPSRTGYGTQDFTVTQTVDGIESDSTPVTLDYGQNAATFTSPTEGAQVPGTPLQFTGTGTPGADIEIHGTDFTQDTAIATATVKPDGTWTATNTTITLPQGPYQFWAHQHTKGGKVGYSHVTVTVR